MKEKEAPEKVYLFKNLIDRWSYDRLSKSDIEYTRTDAFIEKACDFFEENIEEENCKIGFSEWVELRIKYESLDSFIRAFKNYMKGE